MRIENLFHQLESIAKKNNRMKLLKRGVALLCAIVLILTMNTLKRAAIAMQPQPTCGYDYDHTHTADCFDADGQLICGLHEHTDDCYQAPAEEAAEEQEIELGGEDEDGGEAEAVDDAATDAVPLGDYVFDMQGASEARVSDILAVTQLPVAYADIQMVGLVDDLEADAAPVAIALVDGDIAITALRDFETVEIAIVTDLDILTVQLLNGAAAQEAEAEIPEPAEADATDEDTESTESAEDAESTENVEIVEPEQGEALVAEDIDTEAVPEVAEGVEDAGIEQGEEAVEAVETAEVAENVEQAEPTESKKLSGFLRPALS